MWTTTKPTSEGFYTYRYKSGANSVIEVYRNNPGDVDLYVRLMGDEDDYLLDSLDGEFGPAITFPE